MNFSSVISRYYICMICINTYYFLLLFANNICYQHPRSPFLSQSNTHVTCPKWKALSRVWLCDPKDLHNPWNSPGHNTGVGSCSLLQEILLAQELNLGLPHCRQILYHLSHQGSPLVHKTNAILTSYSVDYFWVLKFSIKKIFFFYKLSHIHSFVLLH